MGWDAYATKNGDDVELIDIDGRLSIADPVLAEAFHEACLHVRMVTCGAWDSSLRLGGLCCNDCGDAIDRCGGFYPWNAERMSLTPENVVVIVQSWTPHKPTHWAEASARAFLRTCARHGLGVRFSW